MICDIQGALQGPLLQLTDPILLTLETTIKGENESVADECNTGKFGMNFFFFKHGQDFKENNQNNLCACTNNEICKELKLQNPNEFKDPDAKAQCVEKYSKLENDILSNEKIPEQEKPKTKEEMNQLMEITKGNVKK